MEDEQLEAAARELCWLRGEDPDELVWVKETPPLPKSPRGTMYAVHIVPQEFQVPHWTLVVDEIKRHWQVQAAIQRVTP